METRSCIRKTVGACCRIKEEKWGKSNEEYIRKAFERYFEKDILTYFCYRSISTIITNHCDGCSISDPSQRHHDCIAQPYSEWIEYKFEEMLGEIEFYIVYELTKSFLMDSFSIEEIEESFLFSFPENYLSDVPWHKMIKQKLISSYNGGRKLVTNYFLHIIITIIKPSGKYFV